MINAAEVIKQEYGEDFNFMTPNVMQCAWAVDDHIAYELSFGHGLSTEQLWGVSFVSYDKDTGMTKRHGSDHDIPSRCFTCRSEAEAYVKEQSARARRLLLN